MLVLIHSLLFFSLSAFSCNQKALLSCLDYKGGMACFKKHKCAPESKFSHYCSNFDLRYCEKYETSAFCNEKSKECGDVVSTKVELSELIDSILAKPDSVQPYDFGSPGVRCPTFQKVSNVTIVDGMRASDFFLMADQNGKKVKTYGLGFYTTAKTDCSGYLMSVMKKVGLEVKGPQFDLAPNYPRLFKKCDPKNLQPGDLLLLNKPGRAPDHWIMVSSKGKWPSGAINILDVSSDYYAGSPYYNGALKNRKNLQRRDVFSCVRHKNLKFSKPKVKTVEI